MTLAWVLLVWFSKAIALHGMCSHNKSIICGYAHSCASLVISGVKLSELQLHVRLISSYLHFTLLAFFGFNEISTSRDLPDCRSKVRKRLVLQSFWDELRVFKFEMFQRFSFDLELPFNGKIHSINRVAFNFMAHSSFRTMLPS